MTEKPTIQQLRRKIVQVDRYTDGWDLVVGKVMDRVSLLENRVSDLERELADARRVLRRHRITVP